MGPQRRDRDNRDSLVYFGNQRSILQMQTEYVRITGINNMFFLCLSDTENSILNRIMKHRKNILWIPSR